MRLGLQGPSVLHFTDGGAAPNANLFARRADWSWFDTLEIDGWVPASRRGAVAGVGLANVKSGFQYVVGLKNDQAQYWTIAGSGSWRIEGVLPGTYTLTVYKQVSKFTLPHLLATTMNADCHSSRNSKSTPPR